MNTLIPTSGCHFCDVPSLFSHRSAVYSKLSAIRRAHRLRANSNDLQTEAAEGSKEDGDEVAAGAQQQSRASTAPALDKDLKKVCSSFLWILNDKFSGYLSFFLILLRFLL